MSLLDYFSAFSILLPLAVSLYKYTRLSHELKLLCALFIFGTLVEIISYVSSANHSNNWWLINIYVLTEGAIYFYIIGKWFESGKLFRLTMFLLAIYFLFWIYTTLITGNFLNFNDKEKTIKGIFLIFLSGYLLIRISKEDSTMMVKDFRFWILSAILIYFSVTEVIFATASFVLENEPVIGYAWAFHSIINIISNLLFAIGFACSYLKMSSSG